MTLPPQLARESASDQYAPKKEDKFSFGLWTVGNRGRDPFGDFVRPALDPIESVKRLSQLGAWGINLHDNDLVPIDANTIRAKSDCARVQAGPERLRYGGANGNHKSLFPSCFQGWSFHMR